MSSLAAVEEPRRQRYDSLVRELFPGAELIEASPLDDEHAQPMRATAKAAGYGRPIKLSLREQGGAVRHLVFRVATRNVFGHDWRADRAAEQLLAFDTFAAVPNHVRPLDVGALRCDGVDLVSLRDTDEFYLVTEYAEGELYAEDLRRIAQRGHLEPHDIDRCKQLARWLAALHKRTDEPASVYRRTLRDVIGSGEGIAGIIDGYPEEVPGAHWSRLQAIEEQCVSWRWRLRQRAHRLRRIHGDFHPFNVLFDGDRLALLDASRGAVGDPANDVACMAINYIFFTFEATRPDAAWEDAFRLLWQQFWAKYLAHSGDSELLEVVAPYLTWRILVLCNPSWYPGLAMEYREKLLALAERALDSRSFCSEQGQRLFSEQAQRLFGGDD